MSVYRQPIHKEYLLCRVHFKVSVILTVSEQFVVTLLPLYERGQPMILLRSSYTINYL